MPSGLSPTVPLLYFRRVGRGCDGALGASLRWHVHDRAARRNSFCNMFKNALEQHSLRNTQQDVLKDRPNNPRIKALYQPNRAFKPPQEMSKVNVLRPSLHTTLNDQGPPSLAANTAVKRTSSGLVKAVGQDARKSFQASTLSQSIGSQENPFIFEDSPPKKKSNVQDSVVFEDDDFDSDIDLDIENPSVKRSVVYPTLSQTRQPQTPPKYPNIHRASLHTLGPAKAQHNDETSREYELPPNSSALLDWSSSPAEHFQPPPKQQQFSGFAYTAENMKNLRASSRLGLDQLRTVPAPKPAKRRTLPWLEDSNKEVKFEGPPAEESPYAWNKPASVIKEEQKQFKKLNRITKTSDVVNHDAISEVVRPKQAKVARVHLSDEQRHVIDLVVDHNKSVFFTGSAGTGKSVLLREIISVLRKKYQRETDRVAITASTGLAACNVGGVTLHSFAGIGLGKEPASELVKKIKKNQKAKHRWMRTKILIIDEVSMVDGELFDKLEAVARAIRNNGRPFGGIQLVITGDFFQLPPVPDSGSGRATKFCFDADTWNNTIDHTIGLHHVFRQKDPVFAGMLNEMREGKLSQESIASFRSLSRPLPVTYDLTATELFPTRAEVDSANNTRMQQLNGNVVTFFAKDGGAISDAAMREKLLQNCMAPRELKLKKGSQVMLIKNIDEMLVNGSLGKVVGFMNENSFDQYNADEEAFLRVTEGGAGEDDLNPKELKMKRFLATATTKGEDWPLVRFTNADGTTRDLLCTRESWKIELPNGEVQASRSQIPLILAWALSIHKAQGQTLERVKVDLGKVFEKGQAYVALSRATTMQGLQVLRFDPAKVMAHERVRTFYAGLSKAEGTAKAKD